jgi:hypothetical protein
LDGSASAYLPLWTIRPDARCGYNNPPANRTQRARGHPAAQRATLPEQFVSDQQQRVTSIVEMRYNRFKSQMVPVAFRT